MYSLSEIEPTTFMSSRIEFSNDLHKNYKFFDNINSYSYKLLSHFTEKTNPTINKFFFNYKKTFGRFSTKFIYEEFLNNFLLKYSLLKFPGHFLLRRVRF